MERIDRIGDIAQLIFEVAEGNFDYKIEASEAEDDLDAIIQGVNMLGEELKTSTVSRDFMESIYKGVIDLLFILNEDLTISSVNEVVPEILGISEAAMRSSPISDFLTPESRKKFGFAEPVLREDGQIKNMEISFASRKGYIPTSCSLSRLLDAQKKSAGFLVIAKDISGLKETEAKLIIEKDKAEAASKAKSQFLSNMSHEIRTPLNGIIGFTELLLSQTPSDDQKKYMDMIQASGKNLLKLLNDVLDISKIESDKLSLEKINFNFKENISSNLEPYKHLAQEKKLTLTYDFDPSIPENLIGDPTRINQILINLVGNALKFTKEGNIEIRFVTRQDPKNEKHVILRCEVQDSGIGIPESKQVKIFRAFTQSDGSTTRKFGGSGLGLNISKQLVELMKGEIGLMSPPPKSEKGSLFWFEVSLEKSAPPVVRPSNNIDYQSFRLENNPKFLVVDDNILNRILMQDTLEGLGAQVETAENGKEGMEKALAGDFAIIFMDIQMPVMDGFQAVRELRKQNYKGTILAVSANVYKQDIQKCLDIGMNGYLGKPLARQKLIDSFIKWL